ncbi:hypothetical protein [Acinetobacter sp. ANC 4173]|uniref:hypothetical protein n=1 Tax=Acinetobacter sp. ANC 4173 TaxID=2529837 RepID=UPI0013F17C24|nr:hypothetical protein [Acinetobacter sp. ANC 4173]
MDTRSAAGMPHVAHHGTDAVYGQQKTFANFGSFQSRILPAQRRLNFIKQKYGSASTET